MPAKAGIHTLPSIPLDSNLRRNEHHKRRIGYESLGTRVPGCDAVHNLATGQAARRPAESGKMRVPRYRQYS